MRTIVVLFLLSVLMACEDKPPVRTVLDPQIQALEKARRVEGQLREAGEKRDQEGQQQIQGY